MPNDYFQPKGDPYRYKVKGDTVQFVATQDTAGHRKGETGEVSKSQIINDNPEWAKRHLNVDTSPKAASEPGGTSRPRPDSPQPDTTQRDTTRADSTAPDSTAADSTGASGGGQGVLDMIRQVAGGMGASGQEASVSVGQPRMSGQDVPRPEETQGGSEAVQNVFEMIQMASGASAPDAVQRNAQAKQKEGESPGGGGFIDRNLRGLGIGTRGVLEGVGSTIGVVGDVVNSAVAGEPRPGSTRRAVSSLLDAAGFPEAQTSTEQAAKIANQIGGGMIAPGGAAGSAGRGGRAAGQALSRGSRPVKDLIRMAMGGGPSSADDGLTPAQRLAQQRTRPTDESADLERWLRRRTQSSPKSPAGQNVRSSAASGGGRASSEVMDQGVAVHKGGGVYDVRMPDGSTMQVRGKGAVPDGIPIRGLSGGVSDTPGQAATSVDASFLRTLNRARGGGQFGVPEPAGRAQP